MRIIKKEGLKLIKHPMLWGMTAVFLACNLILVYNNVGYKNAREHFHSLHSTILAYGIDLNAPNPEFCPTDPMAEFYLGYVESGRTLYDKVDMYSLLEKKQALWNYYPVGNYGQFLQHNYDKLQKRLEEIRITGEGNYGFYPGTAEGVHIHSFLYGTLMRQLMLEMPVLLMLSVLYLMDYERIHKTRAIIIATRMGKRIMYRKIFVGIGVGLLFDAVLAVGTFSAFFYCVPLKGLWEVPVSAALMAEARPYGYYPFITFWPLTSREYFALTLLVVALLLIITGLLAAALQLFMHNSYFTFLGQVILYIILYLIASGPFTSFLDVLLCLSPSALWITSAAWFMENELILSFAGNEFWCIGLWSVIGILFLLCGRHHYHRLELK